MIQKKKGSAGWDGIGNSDNEFKSISKKVSGALKKISCGDFNLEELESMPWNRKKKVLKRKYSSNIGSFLCVNITSKQPELENKVYAYINNPNKNICVTSLIIFQRVLKIRPLFKGGIKSPNSLIDMRNWFYYGFKSR